MMVLEPWIAKALGIPDIVAGAWLEDTLHRAFQNGRRPAPAVAFIGAQVFNVIWTLILAYLLFGGFIFQTPTIR